MWSFGGGSTETAHFILFCYLGDDIRCAVSADLKIVARNCSCLKLTEIDI